MFPKMDDYVSGSQTAPATPRGLLTNRVISSFQSPFPGSVKPVLPKTPVPDSAAPAWVAGFREDLNKDFSQYIDKKFKELKQELDIEITASINHSLADFQVKCTKLEEENLLKSSQISVLQQQVSGLNARMSLIENHSMRNNLIFDGIPDDDDDETNDTLEASIVEIFEEMGLGDPHSIQFANCYRLPKPAGATGPRRVMARLLVDSDAQRVLASAHKLKGRTPKTFINRQYSQEVEYVRRIWRLVMMKAKKLGLKCSLRDDKILIQDKLYTFDNLRLIPFDVAEICTEVTNQTVFFHGALTPLSNFCPSRFTYGNIVFSSGEQFLQYSKAKFFNNEEIASRILGETSPVRIKNLGDSLKDNLGKWKKEGPKIVSEGLTEKFRQNEGMSVYLKKLAGHRIVECNPHDTFWSCGLGMRDVHKGDSWKWKGDNRLGEILLEIGNAL